MKCRFIYFLLSWGFLFMISGCSRDELPESSTLQDYLDDRSQLVAHNELIACAVGGQSGIWENPELPISLIYKPHHLGISDLRYYMTESPNADSEDLSQFVLQSAPTEDLFNGFLGRFLLPSPTVDFWTRVSYIANDTLWYCKAIRIKFLEQASVFRPDWCDLDLSNPTEPIFEWQEGSTNSNVIFFQVISDANKQAISGTYTTDLFFRFYDTSNVVLNVSPPGVVSALTAASDYQFTLMGVSADNWVNLILQKDFRTE